MGTNTPDENIIKAFSSGRKIASINIYTCRKVIMNLRMMEKNISYPDPEPYVRYLPKQLRGY